jgi:hypothetical protein
MRQGLPIVKVQQGETHNEPGGAGMIKHTDGIQIMRIEESGKFDTFTDAADEMEKRGGGWVEWWDENDSVEKRWVS